MARSGPSLLATDAAVRDRFLDVLRATGCVTAAARATRTTRSTAYRLRDRDAGFAAAWAAATRTSAADSADAIEAGLVARAIKGVRRTRVSAAGKIETSRHYDDRTSLQVLRMLRAKVLEPSPAPVAVMTRAEFIAALTARHRTVDQAD